MISVDHCDNQSSIIDTEFIDGRGTPVLYARLLGSAWQQLAEPIRVIHTTGSTVRAGGRLRIAHGRSRLARLFARLLRLPRASDAAEARLIITADESGERWQRAFEDRVLDTEQYEAGEREFAERAVSSSFGIGSKPRREVSSFDSSTREVYSDRSACGYPSYVRQGSRLVKTQ